MAIVNSSLCPEFGAVPGVQQGGEAPVGPEDGADACPVSALESAMRPVRERGGRVQAPAADEVQWYSLDECFLGTLIRARQAGLMGKKPVWIDTAPGSVLVDAARNLVLVDVEVGRWQALLSAPLTRPPAMQVLDEDERCRVEARMSAQRSAHRLDQLLWHAGWATSAGRLPRGTDLTKPVHLRHWPNLTRLDPVPHAMRMSALWVARGAGLLETAALLRVPARQVFAFYSAASALDLVTPIKEARVHRDSLKRWPGAALWSRLLAALA